eukprot:1743422-Amphidinium_carterae.2
MMCCGGVPELSRDVCTIHGNGRAFVAKDVKSQMSRELRLLLQVKKGGQAVAWGDPGSGVV